MIKGILFDISGVILPEEEIYIEMLDLQKRALREAGISVSDDEFDMRYLSQEPLRRFRMPPCAVFMS